MKETVRAAEKGKAILPYLRSYWLVGLMAGVIALILYYFCRTKDSDVLLWILAPTAWHLFRISAASGLCQLLSSVSDRAFLLRDQVYAAYLPDAGLFLPAARGGKG